MAVRSMETLLVMFMEDGERREFPLTQARTVVGRTTDCDLRVPLSSVSRRQCEFVVEDDTILLRDLGSSNGTFHNGDRVQETTLAAGDEVAIGPIIFTVVIDGKPANVVAPVRPSEDSAEDDSTMMPAMIDDDIDDLEDMDLPTGLTAAAAPPKSDDVMEAAVAESSPTPDIEVLESEPAPPAPVKSAKKEAAPAADDGPLDDDDFADLLSMDDEDEDEEDAFAALEALADEVGDDEDGKS